MESEGKAAGGRVTCSCGGGYDWVGCDFFCVPGLFKMKLRESLTFVTLPETTVTSNKSHSYLHWIDND